MIYLWRIALSVTLLFFVSGCTSWQAKPSAETSLQEAKPLPQAESTQQTDAYHLRVLTQPAAKVRILNIKPKYTEGMLLEKGNYLIEVSKKGYEKYKKWITLAQDKTLVIALKKVPNPYDTSYFHYVKDVVWNYTQEHFCLVYDQKSKLVWALQTPYIIFMKERPRLGLLAHTLKVEGKPWPKIIAAKIDTLIYSGYYRYSGRNFLFQNKNALTLYKASQPTQAVENFAKLDALAVNGRVQAWRLPKEEEIRRSNPFKKYQKHFEVDYKRYSSFTMNLPVLYTRLKKSRFYSSGAMAYRYNPQTKLYDGSAMYSTDKDPSDENIFFALNHPKNFALVLPVRKKHGFYDSIIFDTRLSAFEKFKALSSALIKKSVKSKKSKPQKIANAMASKAMKMLFGDPYITRATLYGSSGDFRYRLGASQKKRGHLRAVRFDVSSGEFILQSVR